MCFFFFKLQLENVEKFSFSIHRQVQKIEMREEKKNALKTLKQTQTPIHKSEPPAHFTLPLFLQNP